jgi:hypothetical protein
MTLDGNGNLGVGTTSPSSYGKFAVTGSGTTSSVLDNGAARITDQVVSGGGSYTQYYKDLTPNYVASIGTYSPASSSAQSAIVFADYQGGWTERARIDSSGNVGIGTTTPVAKMQIKGTGTSGQVTASWILENGSSGTAGMDIIGTAGASRWRFLYGGGPSTGTNTLTESMCILTEGASAGNVGIGTSSPAYKLDVTGTMRSSAGGVWNSSFTSTTGGLVYCDNTTGGGAVLNIRKGRDVGTGSVDGVALDALNTAANTVVPMILRGTPVYIADGTGTTTFSGGNLGLGISPSAWGSIFRAEQIGNYGAFIAARTDSINQIHIGANTYYDGANWVYKNTATATRYVQNSGAHEFYTAASGTAGNPITFTQAMTLDASGNLGVGTTSPQSKLDVETSASGALGAVISVGNLAATATSNECSFGFKASSAFTSGYYSARISSLMNSATVTDNAMLFYTYGSGSAAGGTERARITSDGRFYVGTQTSISDGKEVISFVGSANSGIVLSESANTSGAGYIYFGQGSTIIGSVTRVGATSAVAYNTTSDYRLKTVTGAVTGHGARIDALKPVDYQWKEDNSQARGFLAHEFQAVYANSVTGTKDAVDADGNPIYQSMQASTSEVIADLVAEIQSLRQRLSAANL